ncbi:hypothetical protein OPKNFCMD_4538 [Methylobacterium crusticola]|uniref:Uncharacterized protein n=1 Tax=Methylobacterium crusticola TaxID=1697972 RepID=A0ABQ4R2U2_9HYPH|nr:hypothetical protein [Methylobacterium crusticola]GJD51779.1 hypothetical protein OPKNFCMD_4538 [Methylobacterium crusticola]
MPQIEISQQAYDALKLEVERLNAQLCADKEHSPATIKELASDFLIHACNPFEADPHEPEIPF